MSLSELLFEKLSINPRFSIYSKNFSIITAADSNVFYGLQLLTISLKLTHDFPITVFDIGLDKKQIEWCESKYWIKLIKFDKELIVPKSELMWQTWNKPLYILNAKTDKVLWIDCDCIISDNLQPLVNHIHKNPLFVKDYFLPFDKLIKKHISNTYTFANGGVLGFDIERDRYLIDDWIEEIKKNDDLLFWDQGALNNAIQKNSMVDSICLNDKWNQPSKFPNESIEDFLEKFQTNSTINHFAGSYKPWFNWNSPIDINFNDKLKLYVLWHNDDGLKKIPNRTFIEKINLNELEIPSPFNQNQLAEARIFLSDISFDSEYIGLCTAKWSDKYIKHDIIPIHELDKLIFEPDVVWAASIAKKWTISSNQDHPGMGVLLKELSRYTGMPLDKNISLYANNFICHKDVFNDLLKFWRDTFFHFWNKYKFDIPMHSFPWDERKNVAYFYERFTLQYFSNRPDLKIKQISNNEIKLRFI